MKRIDFKKLQRKSISSIVQNFKASVTRENNKNGVSKKIWQSNFYEHVIRTEKELEKCREYIMNNPLKWQLDRNNLRSEKLKRKDLYIDKTRQDISCHYARIGFLSYLD